MTQSTGAPAVQSPAPAPVAAAPVAAAAPAQQAPLTLDATAAAPAAAPAQAPAAAPAAQAPNPDAVAPVTYEPTGNASLDTALSFLGKLGISPDDPAMIEAGKGNFALLRAQLAVKGQVAQGWEAHLQLGEVGFAQVKQARDAQAATDRTSIINIAGSEKAWAEVQAWASQKAEPHEKASINAMMQAGGLQAKAAAMYLCSLYARASGTTVEPASVTDAAGPANNSASVAAAMGPLDPTAYKAAIKDLRSRVGVTNLDQHPDYIKLNNRRRAWRG